MVLIELDLKQPRKRLNPKSTYPYLKKNGRGYGSLNGNPTLTVAVGKSNEGVAGQQWKLPCQSKVVF